MGWGHVGGFQYMSQGGYLPQHSSFAPQIPGFGLFPPGVGPFNPYFNPQVFVCPSHPHP
jgi:hypothetical protein